MALTQKVYDFLSKLQTVLSSGDILTSHDDTLPYRTDWTRLEPGVGAVVFPRTTEQVAKILKLCSEAGISVVPSGGRTGLAGGAVANHGELALNLTKMNRIDPVDTLARTVRVQSGATTEAVHEHCASKNLSWPIDLASKGSCTVGGNISTNAGGLRVIRYGMTRKWVSSLQIVTMKGEVIELNRGLEKNNTGYDLLQLVIGSEGTLAVITEATLKLTRKPKSAGVLLFGVESIDDMVGLFGLARSAPFDLLACEYFSAACSSAVDKHLNRRPRFHSKHAYYLLLEIEDNGAQSLSMAIESWLQSALETGKVKEGMLAETSEDVRATWGLREGITESLAKSGALRKYDICVPIPNLAKFLNAVVTEHARKPRSFGLYLFGHLGDGSPHVNIVQNPGTDVKQFDAEARVFEQDLYALLKSHDGSASSEHGVGLLKKGWVTFSRSPEELHIFKAIKHAFDPQGLLNPGKIVDS